jgi:anaerobic magnesium-protoporphyrin IX monomethyl ester cyclase
MGIKVLFLYPNTFGMNMIPQAMALFSALLKKEGHQVEIFDSTYYSVDFGIDSDGTQMDKLAVVPFNMEDRGIRIKDTSWKNDLLKQVDRFKPDLIGMSCTEDMYELGMLFLNTIKDYKIKNNVPVIAGGVFPTFAPEIVIKEDLIDLVCVGEGENALIDLCKKIENKKDYSDVTNCWVKTIGPEYLKNRNIIKKNSISKPVDINTNPIIDIGLFEENRLYRPMGGKIYKMFPVETIRGCPYTCKFCNSPDQMDLYKKETGGGYFRKKNIDLVSKELKHFKNNLGVEYNYFWADTFLAMNKTEFEEFCDMYSEIKIPFWFQTRPETINDYNMKKLADVGLDRISFGVEHGNETFRREVLDRRWSNKQIIDKLKIPHKYGINFSVNNITGFPKETKKLAFDTIELNRNIDADNANIHTFVPFHGTPLRRMCEELGYIKPETITKCIVSDPVMSMPQYPIHEIKGITKCFNLYVKFPKNRWPEIEKAEKDDEEGKKIFEKLSAEYLSVYMPKPNSDPHGGIEDFIEQEKQNNQCIPMPIAKNAVTKSPHEDEMQ